MKIFQRDLKTYTGNCNKTRLAQYRWRKRVSTGDVRPENLPGAVDDLPAGAGVACIAMLGVWLAVIGAYLDWHPILMGAGVAIVVLAFWRMK